MPEVRRFTKEQAEILSRKLIGQPLPLKIRIDEDIEVRSERSHNHQFAEINDMFQNLPESHKHEPYAANADCFRKHGLIMEGYCDVYGIVCATHKDACDAAPHIAKSERKLHGYALATVKGNVIAIKTPHSQSMRAMGKDKFQESKDAVLGWARHLVGLTIPEER